MLGTERNENQEDIEIDVTEDADAKLEIPTIRIEHCDTTERMENNDSHEIGDNMSSSSRSSVGSSAQDINGDKQSDMSSSPGRNFSPEPETSRQAEDQDEIQETLADIAQNFTSKLDSIRSTFTMSLDRNVASCLGKPK